LLANHAVLDGMKLYAHMLDVESYIQSLRHMTFSSRLEQTGDPFAEISSIWQDARAICKRYPRATTARYFRRKLWKNIKYLEDKFGKTIINAQ